MFFRRWRVRSDYYRDHGHQSFYYLVHKDEFVLIDPTTRRRQLVHVSESGHRFYARLEVFSRLRQIHSTMTNHCSEWRGKGQPLHFDGHPDSRQHLLPPSIITHASFRGWNQTFRRRFSPSFFSFSPSSRL